MADFVVSAKAQSGVQGPREVRSDGMPVQPRSLRDGTLFKFDWLESLSLEGRVFGAFAGTLDTPITQQTAYDATLPSLCVQVPDNIVAIPIYCEVWAVATAAVQRVHFAISPVKVLTTTAAAFTPITPLNVRLGSARASACQAAHTVSVAGGTFTTGAVYMSHRGQQLDIDANVIDGGYSWSVNRTGVMPLVEDGGSICAFFYNSTGSAFAKIFWAELDKEDFRLRE